MSMHLCSSTFILNLSLHTRPSHFFITPTNFNCHHFHLHKSNNKTPFKFLHFSLLSRHFSHILGASSSYTAAVDLDELPGQIYVTQTKEPNSRVRFSVTVPPTVCDDCYRNVMRELSKMAQIPGFRPGMEIPDGVLLSYAGKQNIQRATIESILERILPHALSSVNKIALQDSIKITTKFADMEETFIESNTLKFDVVVDVLPEVRWNPVNGYKNLKIVVEIDKEITAEVACERELRRRHKTLGPMKIITDRGLQVGDVVVIDISATTIEESGKDSQNIPSVESKGFNFDTEDAESVIPGFLDSIIGIRPGETKSFPLVFPESWREEDLRGMHAQFTVDCKELFYRDMPPLDDSLAEKLQPGCSTLEEVKEALLESCRELEQTAKDQATDNAILDQLRQMVEVDIPESLFEEEGRQMYGAKLLEVQAQMKLSAEQLEALTNPKTVKQYIEHEKENIILVVKQNLAVGDIFKRENLQVTTDEVVKEVEKSIAEFKKLQQEYDEERIKEQVQEVLEGAKVLEWLREHADIQYITK